LVGRGSVEPEEKRPARLDRVSPYRKAVIKVPDTLQRRNPPTLSQALSGLYLYLDQAANAFAGHVAASPAI
jgi:hypothetical protein